jgi:NAD-dependent deacetylase
MSCGTAFDVTEELLNNLPPRCNCGGIVKPDFVFFGEGIPRNAAERADDLAGKAEVMLLLGTTGEVYPAASIPSKAKERGASVIEINPHPSNYTGTITDIHIPLTAVTAMKEIVKALKI